MSKPQTTIVQTTRPEEGAVSKFTITHVGNIDTALNELRRCIKEWGKTSEGIGAYQNSSEDYNWGDFINDVDTRLLQIGSICPVKFNPQIIKGIDWENIQAEILIRHDELLMSKWD